jgi:hypothetical protein
MHEHQLYANTLIVPVAVPLIKVNVKPSNAVELRCKPERKAICVVAAAVAGFSVAKLLDSIIVGEADPGR